MLPEHVAAAVFALTGGDLPLTTGLLDPGRRGRGRRVPPMRGHAGTGVTDGVVTVAGVDLGASGGRVIAARVPRDGVELHEVSRFANEPVLAGGTLHWDILRLYANVVSGLKAAAAAFPLASAGIDSWGCDYGLLDGSGALIGNPVHYRDRAHGRDQPSRCRASELYATTGIQHLPFNTIYQVAAAAEHPGARRARGHCS